MECAHKSSSAHSVVRRILSLLILVYTALLPCFVFLHGAKKCRLDTNALVSAFYTGFAYVSEPDGVKLSFAMNRAPRDVKAPFIAAGFVPQLTTPPQGIEQCDGTPLAVAVAVEIFGKRRNRKHPLPGSSRMFATRKTVTSLARGRGRDGE